MSAVTEPPFIRTSDGWDFPVWINSTGTGRQIIVPDGTLSWISVDHRTRLQFGVVEIVIESPFLLRTNGADVTLDPAQREALGPLLAIYPDTVELVRVDTDATLRLKFQSGAEMAVRADPQFEAWSVVGPGAKMLVCLPGDRGEIAIWSDTGATK